MNAVQKSSLRPTRIGGGENESQAPGVGMRMSVVGCGDAFGSGGRSHACFRLDAQGRTLVVDFGASAMVAWSRLGMATDDIDAVVVSHLHGDHFGGLPFLLLECQFVSRRARPLTLAGPPGLKSRLEALCEALFPGMTRNAWTFPLDVREIEPGQETELAGFAVLSAEVRHPSGAPATALRVSAGRRVFAYSGDTQWVEVLEQISAGADLFVCECYSGEVAVPNHIDWPTLRARMGGLSARAVMATHLGRTALKLVDEMRAAGLRVAEDGQSFDL